MKRITYGIVICWLSVHSAQAFDRVGRGFFGVRGGIPASGGAVVNLGDCSQTTVQNALDASSDGETLVCPAGSWSWSNVNIVNHDITLQGAGIGLTNISITAAGGIEATSSNTKAFRITGFTFASTGNFGTENGYGMLRVEGGKGWRIDNNRFEIYSDNTSYDGGNGIYTYNDVAGVIDHNTFTKGGGAGCMHASVYVEGDRNTAWGLPSQIGAADHAVFIEDNLFNNPESCPSHNAHAYYGQHGGIGVFRYNEVREMNVDNHGFCAAYAGREVDINNNVWVSNGGAGNLNTPLNIRGATGVIYDNDWSAEPVNYGYWLQEYREASPGSCGYSGTSFVSGYGNVAGSTDCATTEGYPCAQQIGRGQDNGSDPLYIWNNTGDGSITNGSPTYIQSARDYYLNAGAKPGYTAYTYPHPLVSGEPPDTTDPSDPTSLVAAAVSASQINLTWTASTDNVGVTGYNIERCTGAACSSWAQIDTSPTNSYSSTGLSASTLYRYRVSAYDAAANTSGYSNIDEDTTNAAGSGYYTGTVINAASGSRADVQSAINSASSLDIVRLPADCSATWSTNVNIPDTKGIMLDGNNCTIAGRLDVDANSTTSTRVTGFNFDGLPDNGFEATYLQVNGSNSDAPFRIDHCFFRTTADSNMISINGLIKGIIDNNQLLAPDNTEMIHNEGGSGGWSVDVTPGSDNAVYLEDNHFEQNELSGNPIYAGSNAAIQNYNGARMVFRYNTLIMTHIDVHGTAGSVGGRWWEIYENEVIVVDNGNLADMMALRGGSGVAFNNFATLQGSAVLSSGIALREEDTGTYPLLYQIGRGKDQTLDPAYFWNNESGNPSCSQGCSYIQVNRDYYNTTKPDYTTYTYPHPLTTTLIAPGE